MIKGIQDLLDKYVSAERGVLSEYSSDWAGDLKELEREVRDFAALYGLTVDEEWFV